MINTEKELLQVVEKIRSEIPDTSLLLFRGQTQKHDKIRSGRARINTYTVPEIENGWNAIVNRITERKSGSRFNQAILQHYGLHTFYIDLTSDPLAAAWFASNKYVELKPTLWVGSPLRLQDEVMYNPIVEGEGYLYVLEIPNYKEMLANNELFDITQEDHFLRPIKQSAYLMLDQPPRLPDPNSYVREVLLIDRAKFNSSKTMRELFPNPKQDNGYKSLLETPYVQCPASWLKKKSVKERMKEGTEIGELIFGRRAIRVPLYTDIKKDLDGFNPKWDDFTLYEPTPFQTWKLDPFCISQAYDSQKGTLGETVKITVSPSAFSELFHNKDNVELDWPLKNSNSIFFTKAQLVHDKVMDPEPPFLGIWLHRNHDLILELHLACEDGMNVLISLGHAYQLSDGKLKPVRISNECDCNDIQEKHIPIISALLRIQNLIKKQKVALIQHSFDIEDWYVLL